MAELLSILKQASGNLQFEKEVLERRADMADQCECLAAWVEGRECICGDQRAVSVPMSTSNLKKAHNLIGEIEGCDARLARVSKASGNSLPCAVELDDKQRHRQNGMVYYEDDEGHYYDAPRLTLPKAVLIAALKEERIRLMIALHETGIVSVGRDNIKAIPK